MKTISKYQCDFCSKLFDSSESCIKHEKRHNKIKMFIDNIDKTGLDQYEFDIDSYIRTGKAFLDKRCIFGFGTSIQNKTFSAYDKMISYYKNTTNDLAIKSIGISGSSYTGINIFENNTFMMPLHAMASTEFCDAKYKNFDIDRNQMRININVSNYFSDEDRKYFLKQKLLGVEIQYVFIDSGKTITISPKGMKGYVINL